ncbi:putative efflux system protein [Podospora fimiseda]|uniref:Efflux system protein n=1 Tax=Podospora fimiseda TaxID=252190 RepID=A0AAN7GXK7_9PEZI|nr:putative efflux system protein [Podospora fimiseda]
MASNNLDLPKGAESQAPTIVPDNTSMSDDEKKSTTDKSTTDKTETNVAEKSASVEQPAPLQTTPTTSENEKQAPLSRKQTAASNAGSNALHQVQTREDGEEYPTGMKLGLIILALCLSVFVMALDNSIISTAIPKITDQFQSLPDVGWYGSAYLLTTAALQLLFGRFYTFFSIKWVYLIAIFIFEVGSLICGVANNSVTLIVGRAIAGVGSAGIFSGALTILAYSVPLAKRPIYTGAIGSMYGLASISGPLMGGAFTDNVTWRWCFYINLPIGAITIAVIIFFFPDPKRKESEESKNQSWKKKIWQFDPIGTSVFMPAIISLLLALQWGGTEYDWNSWRIILLFCVFGVLIIIFVFVQWKQQDLATVPPRIFLKRSVWSSGFFIFCLGGAFLGCIYYLPLWFQAVKDASAVKSGIMNLPMLISLVIVSVVVGGIVTVWGYYTPFMIFCAVVSTIGYGLMITFEPDTGAGKWIGYQILVGVGIGAGMQQPLMAVQTVLDIVDVPTGASVIIFLQTLGGALFVAVSQNVFTNKLVEYVAEYVPEAFGGDASAILMVGATSVQEVVKPEWLDGIELAYNDALTQTFYVFTILSALSIIGAVFVEWKSVKGKAVEMIAA